MRLKFIDSAQCPACNSWQVTRGKYTCRSLHISDHLPDPRSVSRSVWTWTSCSWHWRHRCAVKAECPTENAVGVPAANAIRSSFWTSCRGSMATEFLNVNCHKPRQATHCTNAAACFEKSGYLQKSRRAPCMQIGTTRSTALPRHSVGA